MIAMEEEAGAGGGAASSKALKNEATYMSSIEREKHGTCSARMRIASVHAVPASQEGGCGRGKEQVVVLERFDTDAGFERLFASTRRPMTDLALLEGHYLCISLSVQPDSIEHALIPLYCCFPDVSLMLFYCFTTGRTDLCISLLCVCMSLCSCVCMSLWSSMHLSVFLSFFLCGMTDCSPRSLLLDVH